MSLAGVVPALPASAYTAAMIGVEALVPPTWFQPPLPLEVSNTATPVLGSATAATSALVRLLQPVSCCQDGLGSTAEQPEPVPSPPALEPHTVSVQPREFDAVRREVPPTDTTSGDVDG